MANNDTLWLQAAGADPAITYSALDARRLIEAALTEGVVGPNDLKVTQRATGANLSVDVAGGLVAITGDDIADQGRYLSRAAALNTGAGSVATGPGGSNARIDLIIARMYDKLVTGTIYGLVVEVIAGTAAASPVAPAVPNGAIALAEVRMNATDTSVLDARITDRRVFAAPPALVLPAAFSTPTLAGAWVNYGAGYQVAGYRKIADRVELRGTVKTGTVTVFTLPAGYRPQTIHGFSVVANSAIGIINVYPTGNVSFDQGAATAFLHLNGISFSVL